MLSPQDVVVAFVPTTTGSMLALLSRPPTRWVASLPRFGEIVGKDKAFTPGSGSGNPEGLRFAFRLAAFSGETESESEDTTHGLPLTRPKRRA